MKSSTKEEIKQLVKNTILRKFKNYAAETEHKPFFQALFSDREIVTGSLIQSLYTVFGMSIYEQIAVILAKSAGFHAERQYSLLGKIDPETEHKIDTYWNNLKTSLKEKKDVKSNKIDEIEMIRDNIKPGYPLVDGDSTVDVYIKKPTGEEYYIDITTVKNNLKGFEVLKLKMLRWVGLRLSTDINADVSTLIAIPYNPYYPAPYMESRWNATILDGDNDILIQEEFWNFVGDNENTYNDLIEIFKEVGLEIEDEIKEFFKKSTKK